MTLFIRPRTLLAAGVAALALAAGVLSAAQAARAPGWRIVRILRHCGNDNMSSVTAVSATDAWAIGEPPWNVPCGTDVEHWDGSAWRRVPVPRGLRIGSSVTPPVTATSATNAWIFPVRAGRIGSSSYAYNYALRWNGKTWRASRFPRKLIVSSAVALGPADVWAFGWYYRRDYVLVPYTARYNGHAWHRAVPPADAVAVSALSRTGMWAIGPTRQTAARALRRQVFVAMRWTGRGWHTLAVPKLSVPKGQAYLSTADLVMSGPRDIWWSYQAARPGGGTAPRLLRWDGGRWRPIGLPAAIGSIAAMTQDGHGGIWLTADVEVNFSLRQYWYHDVGGRWTRHLVATPRGYGDMIFGMTWIPGTTSQWADGEADANTGTHTVGVIAKFGP